MFLVDDVLTSDKLIFILNFTWKIRSKWESIGLALGIDQGTLDAIKKTEKHVVSNCFQSMLNQWLHGIPGVPKPTLLTLAEVLRSPTVGEVNLSDTIYDPQGNYIHTYM